MTWDQISAAFSNVTDIMSNAMTVITGNAGLLTLFVAGLIPVGFRIFKRAKRAVK